MPAPDLPDTPEARREALNFLGARYDKLDKDEKKLHDALAKQVAKDEDTEINEEGKE